MTLNTPPHIPVCRLGRSYTSLDRAKVVDGRTGDTLATVSQANAGLIRRDLRRMAEAREQLRRRPCRDVLDICARAGELFLNANLPLGDNGSVQSPQQYVAALSASSGLPHVLCRQNMAKIHTVLTRMESILLGLTRGLATDVIDAGLGEQAGVAVSFTETTEALGAVLPSNSPGVNSIWLPAVALKIPVAIKPGRDEPWTPLRIIQALMAAGYPREAFGFYPTDHEGADAILTGCGRSILFGDDATIGRYAGDERVQLHGTGRSKIILGPDRVDDWRDVLDVILSSILDNGGRSCVNASCIIVPKHADEIADALAKRLTGVAPRPADDTDARLAAFVNPRIAVAIDGAIEAGLATGGAADITARHRRGPRRLTFDRLTYLLPTIVRCDCFDHPLANAEFLFPFASVVQMSIDAAIDHLGPTLVATVITDDDALADRFVRCPSIDRLNLGAIPTTRVAWDQPHEGNLFEFLYRRRAVQTA